MKRRTSKLAAILGCAVMALPAAAHGYCRTADCATKQYLSQVCAPAQPDDCGTPFHWPSPCVGYAVQKDASAHVSLADTEAAVAAAFATWMKADCEGGDNPRLQMDYMGPVECQAQEYDQSKKNANIIVFRDEAWPYQGASGVLAFTTVSYNAETGEIYDADMELNSHDNELTTGDSAVKFDLLSILTHEAGHFLGLAHSADEDATMFARYEEGSTSLRDLTGDDAAGICAVYPPGAAPGEGCMDELEQGFSPLCAAAQPEEEKEEEPSALEKAGGCSVSQAPGGRSPWTAALGLAGLCALAAVRRRGRRAER